MTSLTTIDGLDNLGQRLAAAVGELVRIPSVNPEHAGERSAEPGEAALVGWLADRAASLRATVVIDEVIDGRPNLYTTFAGTSSTTLAIDAHLDTVGVEHMTRDPFDGVVEGSRVFGRGSVDTKATWAIVLAVLEDMGSQGLTPVPTVQLVGTVGEEVLGMIGAARYQEWLGETGTTIDKLIAAEPTDCTPVYGHKGGFDLMVHVHGEAAHASNVDLGVNAISTASKIVASVDAEHARLQAGTGETDVGTGSVAVTMIDGFTAPNIIPDHCTVRVHRRVAPGEDLEAVVADLSTLVVDAAQPVRVEVDLVSGIALSPFYRDPSSELIANLSRISGNQPGVAAFGTNAMVYGDIAPEMVIFGPGSIDQAHKAEEWIEIDELVRAYEIYWELFSLEPQAKHS